MTVFIYVLAMFYCEKGTAILPLTFSENSFLAQPDGTGSDQRQYIETCFLEVDPFSLFATGLYCENDSSAEIVFDPAYINGGHPPYVLDWDNLDTPFNDIFHDDGSNSMDSVPAGVYAMIVTDYAGCTASATVEVEVAIPMGVTTIIDSITVCEQTGGIQIVTVTGPGGYYNFNWDFANTPFDDDLGAGNNYFDLPASEDDSEDLISGLPGGIYYLTLTVRADPADDYDECTYRDTFDIRNNEPYAICPLGDAFFFIGSYDPTKTYQWQIDSLAGFELLNPDSHYAGTTTPLLEILDAPTSWYGYQYRCRIINGPDTTYSQIFTLRFRVCWQGGSIGHWSSPTNWTCNKVPDTHTEVYVKAGTPRVFSNAYCRNIRLFPGAAVDVKTTFRLNVTGGE